MTALLAAVDVGTGSARAGIVSADGRLLGRAERAIDMRRTGANRAEHDSEQIWNAVCAALHAAIAEAGASPEHVVGLGFDATCSLVVRGRDGAPVAVSPDAGPNWDTIVWLDHRSLAEAAECTTTGHEVVEETGGVMSPEMQVPKLMWLKRHLPESWARAGHFFDLVDYLTWRATGSLDRSQSTLTCKWTWLGNAEPGWRRDFLEAVGLAELVEKARLPERASPPGADLGPLTPEAAAQLGLTTNCRVGAGLIDAHAGALGVLGGLIGDPAGIDRHLALIAGTSSCVVALSENARRASGLWGPYYGALLPGLWLTEAGQSASGALLDHVIRWHAAGGEPTPERHGAIAARIAALRAAEGPDFARGLHVLPDFHGNRSPLGEPGALGMIAGLDLDVGFDSLARLYWRAAVGIALGLRQILEVLDGLGYGTRTLHLAGGHGRNPLLIGLYADATGCALVEPESEDATLLGTAMLAAAAAGLHPSLTEAGVAMSRPGRLRRPDPARRAAYDRDYEIFRRMQPQRRAIEAMSAGGDSSAGCC